MKRIAWVLAATALLAGCHRPGRAGAADPNWPAGAVTTYQYNNARTGADPLETALTLANVNAHSFGLVARLAVDGPIYAQPLYLPGVRIPGQGVHDVVFVATENDTVYAFDAHGQLARPLWRRSFLNAAMGVSAVPAAATECGQILPTVGITATPVLDPRTGALLVLARTEERGRFVQRLHALNVATGQDQVPPRVIQAEAPGRGEGAGAAVPGNPQAKTVRFDPLRNNPRAGLLLTHGVVYLAWASSCDDRPYHGWVIAYRARDLRQVGAWCATPNGTEGGIWQSGNGLAADARGDVFFATGNGTFDAAGGGRDYGDSVVELVLGRGGLSVQDYFTPFDQAQLQRDDKDLSSAGVILLPQQPGPNPELLLAQGKKRDIYLLNRRRLGGFHPGNDSQIVQSLRMANGSAFSLPAYFEHRLYSATVNQLIQVYTVQDGRLLAPPAQGTVRFPWPGATPVISSNHGRQGIVWLLRTNGRDPNADTVLYAFNAADIRQVLYASDEAGGRAAGAGVKFAVPTVADGRVYVGTQAALDIYGLLPTTTSDITKR
ncbi:MAG: hypothetical protein ACRD2E_15240 [Terriglobales bacterium]